MEVTGMYVRGRRTWSRTTTRVNIVPKHFLWSWRKESSQGILFYGVYNSTRTINSDINYGIRRNVFFSLCIFTFVQTNILQITHIEKCNNTNRSSHCKFLIEQIDSLTMFSRSIVISSRWQFSMMDFPLHCHCFWWHITVCCSVHYSLVHVMLNSNDM